MRHRLGAGLWEIFVPELLPGTVYKFEIGAQGKLLPLKADPFAFQSELRPKTASVVANPEPFAWSDADYLKRRSENDQHRSPISIYEVHLGSWKRHVGGLADTIVDANEAALEQASATGIQFAPVDVPTLSRAIERSVRLYADRKAWISVQKAGMKTDVSWEKSAARYTMLYKNLLHRS